MSSYLHGIEVLESPGGAPPISTISSSVIGLLGTTDKKDAPNDPTLITSLNQGLSIYGDKGVIYESLRAIFQQTNAKVIVVNASVTSEKQEEGNGSTRKRNDSERITYAATKPNWAKSAPLFLSSSSTTGYTPRILIGPYEALQDLVEIAKQLRGIVIVDVEIEQMRVDKLQPNANSAPVTPALALKDIRDKCGDDADRVFAVYPKVKVSGGDNISASPYVAGLIAKSDEERGFWFSPSNYPISGIEGLSEPVSFSMGSTSSDANILNEQGIATIIGQNGLRLWGNKTCAALGSKFTFLSVRRTADAINESLLQAHLWAVDQNITKNYIDTIENSVNSYLRALKARGAIIDGKCYARSDLVGEITEGHIYFNFDFTPSYPAEHITFTSQIVDTYLEEIFA